MQRYICGQMVIQSSCTYVYCTYMRNSYKTTNEQMKKVLYISFRICLQNSLQVNVQNILEILLQSRFKNTMLHACVL